MRMVFDLRSKHDRKHVYRASDQEHKTSCPAHSSESPVHIEIEKRNKSCMWECANNHSIATVRRYFLVLRVRGKGLANKIKVYERHNSMDILCSVFSCSLILTNCFVDLVNEKRHCEESEIENWSQEYCSIPIDCTHSKLLTSKGLSNKSSYTWWKALHDWQSD